MTIQINNITTLPCGVNNIKSFTINCCDFFFLESNGLNVIKWSQCSDIEVIELKQKYSFLCYDSDEKCYWALSECDTCSIYRLDLCFQEVGTVTVGGNYQRSAVSLSCDEKNICIAYSGYFLLFDKCAKKFTRVKNEDDCQENISFIMNGDCQAKLFLECRRQIIGIRTCGELEELCIPKQFSAISISPLVCKDNCDKFCFYVLLSKDCSHELILKEYCVCFSEKNKDFCCFNPCCANECFKDCHSSKRCGGYEIMHSIALEEAGIAHILNAEGEKIQKAVALSDNIEQLICVNESVKRTLTQVTLLEVALYSKLEALVCCDDCCSEHKIPCHPSPCCETCHD